MSQIWDHGRLEMMLTFGELGLRVVVVKVVRQASGVWTSFFFHVAAGTKLVPIPVTTKGNNTFVRIPQ